VVPSWCKFPFYQIDFGFGKPTWFSSVHKPLEIVLLVDTKFGTGIEAWVSLEVENMLQFQQYISQQCSNTSSDDIYFKAIQLSKSSFNNQTGVYDI
jgi:hypothetical protein